MGKNQQIMIMAQGCLINCDEGFGVHVIEKLKQCYAFPEHVEIIDGSVLGTGLLGVVAQPDHLIVVDILRRGGPPGDLYRLEDDTLADLLKCKLAHYQSEFWDALVMCQALDKVPETVLLGVEPEDIDTCSVDLTPLLQEKVEPMVAMILAELDRLGVAYEPGVTDEGECQHPI